MGFGPVVLCQLSSESPICFLDKRSKKKKKGHILSNSLIGAFRAGTSQGWGCSGPGGGSVCLLLVAPEFEGI